MIHMWIKFCRYVLFFWWRFVQNLWMIIYLNIFRPNRNFVKSIPVGVVGAGGGRNVGGVGRGGKVRRDVSDAVAVGVVGAGDGVDAGRQEELAGGHADEGSKNGLGFHFG
jgi:hypothetical protein